MMIRFVDICWAHEPNPLETQRPLPFNDYQVMPGDYGLVIDETQDYMHFLSGNKVLCLDKNIDGEKYEYFS